VSTCSRACFPANRPAPQAGPAPWSARRPAWRRSPCACQAAAGSWSTLVRATRHPLAPGPLGQTTKPLADPRRNVEPGANLGCPAAPTQSRIHRRADSADAEAADTGRRSAGRPDGAGHLDTGHLDTWTLARSPNQRTDTGMADTGRGQDDQRHGRRPDILDCRGDRDCRLGCQPSLGVQRVRRSVTHDGSAVTTAASATSPPQRLSSCSAPLGRKPRLGALLSCVGFGWYE
jgi:hypothetical protein